MNCLANKISMDNSSIKINNNNENSHASLLAQTPTSTPENKNMPMEVT
jgi:hypothetical protein